MKKDRKETNSSEPMGIVISRGDKTEPTPVFAAYIWAPAPDEVEETASGCLVSFALKPEAPRPLSRGFSFFRLRAASQLTTPNCELAARSD